MEFFPPSLFNVANRGMVTLTYQVYPGAFSSQCSVLVWPLKNVFWEHKYHRNVVLLRRCAVLDETLTVWHTVTSEQIYTSFWWTFNSLQYFVCHKSNFPLSAEGRLKTYVCNTITWCSNRDGLGAIRNEKCLNCSGRELIFSMFHCAYIKMT